MRLQRFVPAYLFIVTACSGTASQAVPPQPVPASRTAVDQAAASITAASVQRRVEFLASDALKGRDTPSPGLEEAARYAAEQFGSFGLQPAGDSGTFIQRFPYNSSRLDAGTLRVEARSRADTTTHHFARDFFVLPSRVDSVVGTPLFVGRAQPGMTLPASVRNRMLVSFVPDTAMAVWQQSAGGLLQAALMNGASAAVLVLDPLFREATIRMLAQPLSEQLAPIPVVFLSYAAAEPSFRRAGLDLAAVRGRADNGAQPLDGVVFAIRTAVTEAVARVPNIVGVLPGSDPRLRDEYVVFSAHIDHVGVGAPDAHGDSIYNGADDNASGTSAVIEIARAFASLEQRPARSMMFVLVSGEEKGLLGSQHFVANAPVPTAQMVANINLDMIGRNAPDTVVAIGQEYSSLGPAVQRLVQRHPELRLVVAPDLWPEEQLFFRSDHFSFASRDVPAIFFTTGLHEQYHQPGDEAHRIDSDKIARISQLLFRFAHELAGSPARPEWTPEGLAEVRRVTGGR